MIGTLVNCGAIIIGTILGLVIKGGIPERVNKTIMNGLALCVLYIGIQGTLKVDNPLILIVSIVLGGIVGELIDIDDKLKKVGEKIEGKLKNKGGNSQIAQGFVTSTLLFCVGAMAIVGSLDSGLKGDYSTLFAKSALDGVSSILFGASLGIGVMFSVVPVLIYQGGITLAAGFMAGVLSEGVIIYMTGVGSLLIIGLAFNMLEITKIKVGNLLPAIIFPIIMGGVFGII